MRDHLMNRAIIAITGMPGAGKGLVSKVAKEIGFPIFVLGDVIREEASARALSPTPKNLGRLMLEIREKEGQGVVAKRLLSKMKSKKAKLVIVEGVRSLKEIEEFEKDHKTIILGVHTSPDERFQRLVRRKRSDDPKKWEEFVERDRRELKVGIGDVLALSDIMVINESTKEDFKNKIRPILTNLRERY
jgi:dephospho-CoA kinase